MNYFEKAYRYIASLMKGYHIIVVPEEKANTQSFHVSGFSFKVLLASVLVIVPLFFVSALSAIRYQNKLIALKRDVLENQKLIDTKSELVGRLSLLENLFEQMDGTITNLAEVMDVDLESLYSGSNQAVEIEFFGEGEDAFGTTLSLSGTEMINEWVEENGDLTADRFSRKYKELQKSSSVLRKRIEDLYEQNTDRIRFVNASPNHLPLNAWVTSEFGMRRHPITGRYQMHQGIDMAAAYGTPIKAPADGLVVFNGYSGGHGQVVVLDHGYGVATLFAHTSRTNVKIGQRVQLGDTVAFVGSTGASTGPHLHYEVRVDGLPTDPMMFVASQ
jgi:murein DD-endopeptidase MepM/ murein hydrolase activator NlpD